MIVVIANACEALTSNPSPTRSASVEGNLFYAGLRLPHTVTRFRQLVPPRPRPAGEGEGTGVRAKKFMNNSGCLKEMGLFHRYIYNQSAGNIVRVYEPVKGKTEGGGGVHVD